MAVISAGLVKELRERTGNGMMECKKALEANDGDVELAIKMLRESGKTKADKKASRIAAEGMIFIAQGNDNKSALILEVNCETDFVAKDNNFKEFVSLIANLGLQAKVTTLDDLLQLTVNGKTIAELRMDLIAKIGENISIRRIQFIEIDSNEVLGSYTHSGRIGVIVKMINGNDDLGKDIAMHITASKPIAVDVNSLPKDLIEQEKAIYLAQVKDSGKPEAIMEKMIQGKLQKFIDELTLINQQFVKNPDQKISDLLKQQNATVVNFVRFEVGEGIEKETVDFANEVLAQVESCK